MKINSIVQGIFYTSIASIFWGLPQPIYFNELKTIPTIEIVSHRALWSFLFLLILIFLLNRIEEFINIFKDKKKIFLLSITASLIAGNWILFIISINMNRLQDASMGYFISPIISIGLGYIFLKEKLSKLKWISVFLMIFSIIFLLISLKTFPLLAVFISLSWGTYGLIRKKINIRAEVGLLYESGFISLFALPYLLYLIYINHSNFLDGSNYNSILLFFIGIMTIFPLFFFNLGLKFIPLGLAGVIFYLAPTFHFITSIFIFDEDLSVQKLITFIIIWIAVIIFIFDKLKDEIITSENNTQLLG